MKNFVILSFVVAIVVCALILGRITSHATPRHTASPDQAVPHIGRIEVLNGCGIKGAAWKTANYLRSKGFDVKNDGIGNAPTFNYPFTLVVSRVKDMSVARQVGKSLGVDEDKVILKRNSSEQFDVTVYIGSDFHERNP
ncbi:MAG: hypothetical protein GF398_18600 [Chitinivibrionales bacterium]|nr:hypothetical protein [Chitinivibrionales bacterium]